MRKAVQAAARRNQRRKENPAPPPPHEASPTKEMPQQQQSNGAAAVDANKRKASPEEAALTAKNYRLAKELSEIRVRHREECKNVTRLTMENMNLASRCREALSHVAMLKRELAAHQRRSAEALAMQRQNAEARAVMAATPASTPNGSISTEVASVSTPKPNRNLEIVTSTPTTERLNTSPLQMTLPMTSPGATDSPLASPKITPRRAMDVAKELEILDETVASHALKAKAASTPTSTPPPPENIDESPQASLSEPVDSDDFEEESFSTTNQLHPPTTLDDVPGHRPAPVITDTPVAQENIDASNTETTPSNELVSPTTSYFPHTASPKVDNYDEEYPSDFSAVRKRAAIRPKLGMLGGFAENEEEGSSHSLNKNASLDAFEASFATDFPDSFSPRDSVAEEKKSEIYNPFQSPAKHRPIRLNTRPEMHGEPEPIRKDPPGKIRTSQRSSPNKVFMALSQSPRGLDETRSLRPAVSPRQTSPHQPPTINGFRKNGLARPIQPPPLDVKQPETGRSRYDRLTQQQPPPPQLQPLRKNLPFDEPRSDDPVIADNRSSPPPTQDPEDPATPISVKDRASLFQGGGPPRSPEKESQRLSSLRYSYDRNFVDEGDIPMISNIGRSSKTSPPRQDPISSTTNTSNNLETTRSSSYTSSSFRSRLLPWEENENDDMEQRRGARVASYAGSKLRHGGEFYAYAKEEKSERA